MLFVGTSIIHPSTEGVFLLCNILDLLIYRLIIKMIVVALQKLIFFMVFSPVISVLYLVGSIMENSEPLPGSETTLI